MGKTQLSINHHSANREAARTELIFLPKISCFVSTFYEVFMKMFIESVQQMGYYDFDDHFWSPREVCTQVPAKVEQAQSSRAPKLLRTIFRILLLR
jgi:hypothetical protein